MVLALLNLLFTENLSALTVNQEMLNLKELKHIFINLLTVLSLSWKFILCF